MHTFRRLAYITVLAVYFLIFVGGLVRVAGAGLGCPDWPKCFGRWIPPLSVHDIPPEIDPSRFNITLAWIEYGNRLTGMAVGLLVLATALFALKNHRSEPRILYPSLVAALLTAYQGWQGGQVVTSELKPIIVSVHLFVSFVIVSILIFVAQQSLFRERGAAHAVVRDTQTAPTWAAFLWAGGLLQIALGTLVRGRLQVLDSQFPTLTETERLARVGLPHDLHMISGTALAIATLMVGFMILRLSAGRAGQVKLAVIGLMMCALTQIGLGFFFLVFGLSAVLQLYHLWLSGLYIGLSLAAFFALRNPVDATMQQTRGVRRTMVIVAVVIAVMGVGAAWVVQQAETSRLGLS